MFKHGDDEDMQSRTLSLEIVLLAFPSRLNVPAASQKQFESIRVTPRVVPPTAAMAFQLLSTGLAAAVFLLSEPAMGHMAQKVPMSRQWAWSRFEGKSVL